MCNFESCKKGLHPFVKVASFFVDSYSGEAKVVRWCPECGAVVVDMDYDGRTSAGYYKKLQYPNITKQQGMENSTNKLLPADKANELTVKCIEDCSTKELSEIAMQINKAISNGRFSITCNGSLLPETKSKLEELGYDISVGRQYNETYCSISWKG